MSIALLIIDVQNFVEHRINNGIPYYPHSALNNMGEILKNFRSNNHHIIHIVHQSTEEDSLLHPQSPYYPIMDNVKNNADEPVFIKTTSSAFASGEVKRYLDEHTISEVFVIGAVAGFCVNSTVRHGSDLGISMTVFRDAVISFALSDDEGEEKTIHDITMKLLASDFSKVMNTKDFLNI